MTLDQAERDRITRHFVTSFCVEAGAGTGKTTLMVERAVNQVLSGIPISQIVAITFTEKAAGELKQRIREALEKRRSQHPGTFDLLTQALSDLDNAQISTIHGFAASILRERPVEARVDPNFIQLDELGAALLADQVWDHWLDTVLASYNETMKTALVAGLGLDEIRKLFGELYQRREHAGRLPQPTWSVRRAGEETCRILKEAEEYLQFCRKPDLDKGFQQWASVLESYREVREGDIFGLIKFLRGLKLNKSLGLQGNWRTDYCDKLKQKVAELQALRDGLFSSILANAMLLLKQALDRVEQEKSRRNVLDFDDLLLKTRDLLRNDKATRQYFQEQFRSVIVDEFQDTDPLQVEIIFFLCEQDATANRWEEVKLQPGKLCIVGDPKQSIYRFRRADIEIYMDAKGRIESQGEVVPIQENFRSGRRLIDWVNGTFSQLILKEEKYQPAYQNLLTSDVPAEPELPRVTFLYQEKEAEKVDESREMEAAALVSVLQRIRRERWQVRDKDGHWQDAKWGNIAVLFSTLTKSYLYESKLRAADIPYRLEGGKQFFTRQEIHALVACLKAIDDPADEIALVAALKSLFFGFSDEELFRLRQAIGPLSYFKAARIEDGDDGAAVPLGMNSELAQVLECLRSLHEQRNRVSFAYTLERLYRETNALEKHLFTFLGQQAVANLKKAVLRGRAFERAGPTTFRRFVRWLQRLEEDAQQEPESTLVETGQDAVELLSIHKAKGLEFPIVILANISGGTNESMVAIWNNSSTSLEFRIKGDYGVFQTANFGAAQQTEETRLEAESKRLLYVAATRARDHLLISTFRPSKLQGLLKHLHKFIPPASDIPDGAEEIEANGIRLWKVPPADLPRDPELSTRVEVISESDLSWTSKLEQWRSTRTAAFERARISWSPTTASAAKTASVVEASFASPRLAPMMEASALGSAFHRVMHRIATEDLVAGARESAKTHASVMPRYLQALVEQTALEYGLADGTELSKLVRQSVSGVLAPEFRSARRIFREAPFLLGLPKEFAAADKKFPLLYEGVIDLIVERSDGTLLIVDYKTDHVAASEVPERMKEYRQQARIYRAAVERATSSPISDVWFYFARSGVVSSEQKGLIGE